jgi:hypothetical protein
MEARVGDLAAQLAAWHELGVVLDVVRLAELARQAAPLAKALSRLDRAVSKLRRLGIEPSVEAGRLALECLGSPPGDPARAARSILCALGLRLGRALKADEIRAAMRALDALRSELAACASAAEAAHHETGRAL